MTTKNNTSSRRDEDDDVMLPEYTFANKQGVRGKYYHAYSQGYTVTIHHEDGNKTKTEYTPSKGIIVLEPDVEAYFPNSEAVNNALRSLIALVPKKQKPPRRTNHKPRRAS